MSARGKCNSKCCILLRTGFLFQISQNYSVVEVFQQLIYLPKQLNSPRLLKNIATNTANSAIKNCLTLAILYRKHGSCDCVNSDPVRGDPVTYDRSGRAVSIQCRTRHTRRWLRISSPCIKRTRMHITNRIIGHQSGARVPDTVVTNSWSSFIQYSSL